MDAQVEAQYSYQILNTLLDCPDFQDYAHHDSIILAPPPPVHKLVCGPKNITQGFVLGTVPFEEASYEGTLKVQLEWFHQLHLHTVDEQQHTGLE